MIVGQAVPGAAGGGGTGRAFRPYGHKALPANRIPGMIVGQTRRHAPLLTHDHRIHTSHGYPADQRFDSCTLTLAE